jgi:hypothetical protein
MGTPFPTENLHCAIAHCHVDPATPHRRQTVKEYPGPHDQGHRKVIPRCRRKRSEREREKRPKTMNGNKSECPTHTPRPPARRDAGGSRMSANPTVHLTARRAPPEALPSLNKTTSHLPAEPVSPLNTTDTRTIRPSSPLHTRPARTNTRAPPDRIESPSEEDLPSGSAVLEGIEPSRRWTPPPPTAAAAAS